MQSGSTQCLVALNERGVKMPSRNNKKSPDLHSPVKSSTHEDSLDLLSDSRDFSDQYTPMSESRLTTSQSVSLRRSELPPTRTPPSRSQSSRFADRASPSPTFAKSPTMKSILSPRPKLYSHEAAVVSYSQTSSEDLNRNLDLSFTNMGYAEVPAEKPRSLGPPVYETPKTKSFRMHKLKEPNLEDEWNDIVAEKKNRYRDYCCCLFSSSILVLMIAGIIVATLYFILRPSPPTIHITDLNVTSFKLPSPQPRDGVPSLEAGITCVVKITNPNKFATVHHRAVDLTLNFREEVLSQTLVHGFKQSQKNVTNLLAALPKTVTRITDQLDAVELLHEVNLANVRVELRGSAEGHYRLMGINVKHLDAPLLCKLNVKPETEDTGAEIISSSCYSNPS